MEAANLSWSESPTRVVVSIRKNRTIYDPSNRAIIAKAGKTTDDRGCGSTGLINPTVFQERGLSF